MSLDNSLGICPKSDCDLRVTQSRKEVVVGRNYRLVALPGNTLSCRRTSLRMRLPESWRVGYHRALSTAIYTVSSTPSPSEPIVFVHGFTDSHECMLPLARRFDRDVVLLDLRGHGRSDAPRHGYGPKTLAADVASVCREYDAPVLYGHSLGAEVVARAARRDDLDETAVVLEDPPAASVSGTPASRRERMAEQFKQWHRSSHAELREEYAGEYAEELATARSRLRPEALAVEEWPYTSAGVLVADIDSPTLVLRPDPERVDYLSESEGELDESEAVVVNVAGATHTVSRDAPRVVEDEVSGFLSSLSG